MPNSTEIANDALAQIGEKPLTALDDDDSRSRRCKLFYDNRLDWELSKHTWNFAKIRLSIAKDVAVPVSVYSYQYTLPPDCLRPQRINNNDKIDWKEEDGKILTNESSPIILEYIRRETNPVKWNPAFAEAFTTLLASVFAGGIAENAKKETEKYQLYMIQMANAKTHDSQRGSTEAVHVTELTTDVRAF